MDLWNTVEIESNVIFFKQIGPLQLWITHKCGDWLAAFNHIPEEKEKTASDFFNTIDETLYQWQRLIPKEKSNKILIRPVMPNLPIIVKPESPLRIAANAKALFYILIPIWIRIYQGTAKSNHLFELPTIPLSKTWFGEPDDGELCYSSMTSARRTLNGIARRPHQVVCPVHITNNATSDLVFKRLRIGVGHLSIFDGENHMCSNLTRVEFNGNNQIGQVSYETKIPLLNSINKNNILITEAYKKGNKRFSRKNFDTFKFLTGN